MARLSIELPEKFMFTTEIVIRGSDLNYGNHVGHDRLLTLMQDARIALYRQFGFKNELNFEGAVGQVIADVSVVYKSETFLGDTLLCHIAAGEFNKYGFDLLYGLTNKTSGKEVARAKIGIVCFDYDKRKIAPIPKVLLEKLQSK